MKVLFKILGVKPGFQEIFFKNEFDTLSGERKRVILALILILFLTFLSLGFATGSIENLQRKMSNPFTNWVDLVNSKQVDDKLMQIEGDFIESEQKQKQFFIEDIRGSVRFHIEVCKNNSNFALVSDSLETRGAWGLTIESDDELLDKILEDPIWKTSNEEVLENCEIIVSKAFLIDLGFNSFSDIGELLFYETNRFKNSQVYPLKIVAVVEDLPKFSEFVCSPMLYNIIKEKSIDGKDCGAFFCENNKLDGKGQFSFLMDGRLEKKSISEKARSFFNSSQEIDVQISNEIHSGSKKWQSVNLFLSAPPSSNDSIESFCQFLKNQSIEVNQLVRIECISDCDLLPTTMVHNLAFNFAQLDSIRAFKNYMKAEHNVEIDMNQVEAKENFFLVSSLTLLISLILLGFAILSIILFVNSLLKAHLYQMRSNLGTFKAFGLNNRFLNIIYIKIIGTFLVIAILIAFGGAALYDILNGAGNEESNFEIFDLRILFAILLLVFISLYISYRTTKKILGDTPGNLIYER